MLPLFLITFLHFFHPFYVSVTEIEQNQKSKSIEVSVRVFYDDFEKALNKEYNTRINIVKPIDRKKVNLYIEAYLKTHLKIKANGKPLALKYMGYEIDEDASWCYFESDPQPAAKNLAVQDDILFEAHPSQSNMIHAIVDGLRKSTKLDNPSREAIFTF
jgi:hypothetical protein